MTYRINTRFELHSFDIASFISKVMSTIIGLSIGAYIASIIIQRYF